MNLLRRCFTVLILAVLSASPGASRANVAASSSGQRHRSTPAAINSNNVGLQQIGSFGWDTTVIAITDMYAYVTGWYDTLTIFDMTVPTQPVQLGRIKLPGELRAGRAIDGRLYGFITVTNDSKSTSYLMIMDVRDPAAPFIVTMYDTAGRTANQYDIEGSLLYMITGARCDESACDPNSIPHLLILDIADPQNIREVVDATSWAFAGAGIDVVGSMAYVGGWTLTVLDVSNPAAPRWLNRIDGNYFDPHISGQLMFTWSGTTGLYIYDLVNPLVPRLVGQYEVEIRDIAYRGETIYIVTPDAVLSLDVSQPSKPVLLGQVAIPVPVYPEPQLSISFLSSRYVLVFNTGKRTYLAIDIQGEKPKELGQVSFSSPFTAYILEARGPLLYAATEDGLQIFDTSDPDAPVLRATYGEVGWAYRRFQITGDHAYLHKEQVDAPNAYVIEVVDIRDPDRLLPIEVLLFDKYYAGAYIDGHRAYVPDSHLTILELSETTGPQVLGIYEFNDESYMYSQSVGAIYVVDDIVYAYPYIQTCGRCDYDDSVVVLDVHDPTLPRVVGSMRLPAGLADFEISGNFAFILSGSELIVLSIGGPLEPAIIGRTSIENGPLSIEVDGPRAFVSTSNGLTILDVSDPAQPVMRAKYTDHYRTYVQVSANRLYRFGFQGSEFDRNRGVQVFAIVPLKPVVYAPLVFR